MICPTKPAVAWVFFELNDPIEYPKSTKSLSKFSMVEIEIIPPDELPKKEELFPLKTFIFSMISKFILSICDCPSVKFQEYHLQNFNSSNTKICS